MEGRMLSYFKKYTWKDHQPNQKLWSKFKSSKNVKEFIRQDLTFQHIDLHSLNRLAENKLFQLEKENYQLYLFKNGCKQRISPLTSHAENLYQIMQKDAYKREHLQIIFKGMSRTYNSKIFSGTKQSVSSFEEVLDEIIYKKRELENYGEIIKSIHILHTHPSLEHLAASEKSTYITLHPLSKSDISLMEKIQAYFHFPIFLSAITPSRIQYTASVEQLISC